VEADAEIARLKLDKTIREVVTAVRQSYHELLYIREAQTVAGQNLQLLDHLRKIAETAYAQNRATLLDMIKAQSQSGQLRYDALLLKELEFTEKTRLNSLLNRPPDAPIGQLEMEKIQLIAKSLDQLYAIAQDRQEEIQIAEFEAQKADAKINLARYENLPEFKLGLFYAAIGNPDVPQDPPDAGEDALGLQFGVTIPLWFGKNAGRTSSARSELEAAKALKTERINETQTQIRALYFRLENARRLVELYSEELLPQAAHAMEIAETWFREGESSFSDFVETQSVWYNFQLALARARADYGKYLAGLEQLVGQSITENTNENPETENHP
jgi:outer membrane protein TolC